MSTQRERGFGVVHLQAHCPRRLNPEDKANAPTMHRGCLGGGAASGNPCARTHQVACGVQRYDGMTVKSFQREERLAGSGACGLSDEVWRRAFSSQEAAKECGQAMLHIKRCLFCLAASCLAAQAEHQKPWANVATFVLGRLSHYRVQRTAL